MEDVRRNARRKKSCRVKRWEGFNVRPQGEKLKEEGSR